MILVAGSTGVLGTEIVRQLCEGHRPVRALVRSTSEPEKTERLVDFGAGLFEGDVTHAESLAAACRGIGTVISTVTSTASQNPADTIPAVDEAGQLNLVDAAIRAGVSRFVYISTTSVMKTDSPFTTAKRKVERRIVDSGISYTILRPSYFMETWLSPIVGFNYADGEATIYGDGENAISWISTVDVARFAVIAAEWPAARNTILEIGGPDKLSANEAVKIFEQRTGRAFAVNHVPVEVLREQMSGAQDPLQRSFSALMIDYAGGDAIDMEGDTTAISG